MDNLKDLLSQLKTDLTSVESGFVRETQSIVSALTDKHNALKAIKKEIEEITSKINGNLQIAQSNLDTTNATISTKLKEANEITSSLSTKRDSLIKEIDEKTTEISQLDGKLSGFRKIIEDYTNEREALNGSLSSTRVALDVAEVSASKAKAEFESVIKQIQISKDELGTISNEKDILNRDITNKRTEVATLSKSIESLKTAEMSVIKARLAELNQ